MLNIFRPHNNYDWIMRCNQFLLVICLTFCARVGAIAQDQVYTNEIGMNITQVLSRTIANEPLVTNDLAFTFKRKLNKVYLRTGIDVNFSLSNNSNRELTDNRLFLRVGLEKRYEVETWLKIYTGLDLYGGYSQVISTNNSGFGQIELTNTDILGGPRTFMGVHIAMGSRVALEFEGSLQFIARYTNEKLVSFSNTDVSSYYSTFSMTLPQSLYLIVKFGI